MAPQVKLLRALAPLALAFLAGCSQEEVRGSTSPVTSPAAPAVPTAAGPVLAFTAEKRDFGRVSDTAPLEHEFAFVNRGSETLIIEEIKPGCGCTAATLEQREFAPGEGDSIGVVWEPKGHGRQQKHVSVVTNSGLTKLIISAEVVPFLAIEPSPLRIGAARRDATIERRLSLRCDDTELEILGIESSHPLLLAELDAPVENGKTEIVVRVMPNAPWGQYHPKLTIKGRGRPSNGGNGGEVVEFEREVQVSVAPYDEVSAEPAFFAVGRVALGGSFKKEVVLSRPDGGAVRVLDTSIERAALDGMIVTQQVEGESVRVTLEGDVGTHEGSLSGLIVLQTDVPGDRELRLPVYGVVGAPK